jgi:hypothetical protein
MPLVIQPYREEYEPAVQEFNRRLQVAGDPDLVFYKSSQPKWLPKDDANVGASALYNEYFVAQDSGVVRGAYALKHEQVFIPGRGNVSVACYHHPLSEGIVSRSYASVGGLMVRDALLRQPMLYALGMGGSDRPLPRMLKALGWSLAPLPFLFKIVHPKRFLREMQALRTSPLRRSVMNVSAAVGLGWLGIRGVQSVLRARRPRSAPFTAERAGEFSTWTDALWLQTRERYRMAAVRDSEALSRLYPRAQEHFTRLRVSQGTTDLGWAVVGERRRDAKYGSLRVGSILDCWAAPENALAVAQAATRELESANMDLIVSNQSHMAWSRALEHCGFFKGPSNFILAASRKFAELLQPWDEKIGTFHITRADGDGLPRNF